MRKSFTRLGRVLLTVAALAITAPSMATDIGRIKIAKGEVTVEREGKALPATVGMRVQPSDVIRTGNDGSFGITMDDDSLLSAGPNSVVSLDRYAFDPTTNQGRFDTSINKGTLAVISGRIAKGSPEAMTVKTPAVVLGVRGTSFAVGVDE